MTPIPDLTTSMVRLLVAGLKGFGLSQSISLSIRLWLTQLTFRTDSPANAVSCID